MRPSDLMFFRSPDHQPARLLVISDAGADLDDEKALICLAALERLGHCEVLAVTANMRPVIDRARLIRGTLTELGYGRDLPDIPVGMGLGMIQQHAPEPCPTDDECPYMASRDELAVGDEEFVNVLMDAEPKSITLLLISGFADAAALAMLYPTLFIEKIREVVIMGGIAMDGRAVVLEGDYIVPNKAANNKFNYVAARTFYQWCQDVNLPMVIVTREAARGAAVPFDMYDALEAFPSPIGRCLKQRQLTTIRGLWRRANAPVGSPARGQLEPDRDRAWYIDNFLGGVDPGDGDIIGLLKAMNLYDPLTVLAALPQWRDDLFRPIGIQLAGTWHLLIGTEADHGLTNADFVRDLMLELMTLGVKAARPRVPAH
jgi:hypothetical protein